MRAVIQRVSSSTIDINTTIKREISKGLVVFLAITYDDTTQDVTWLASKIINMRIFSDSDQKMNLSVNDMNGDLLIVPQFTLYASTQKGNRPSFIDSAKPDIAIPLYNEFVKQITSLRESKGKVATGEFGADMQVMLINDGPVTIIIDSKNKY